MTDRLVVPLTDSKRRLGVRFGCRMLGRRRPLAQVGRWKNDENRTTAERVVADGWTWLYVDDGPFARRLELVVDVERRPPPAAYPFGFPADVEAIVVHLTTADVVSAEGYPLRVMREAPTSRQLDRALGDTRARMRADR